MPSSRECRACKNPRPLTDYAFSQGRRLNVCRPCTKARVNYKRGGGTIVDLRTGPALERVYERQFKRLSLASKEPCVCGCPDVMHARGVGKCSCGKCGEFCERGG